MIIILFQRNSCSLTRKSDDKYTYNCLQKNKPTLLLFEQNKRRLSKFNCYKIQNIPYQFWSLWLQNQIKSFHRKAQELVQQIQSPSHLAMPSTMNINYSKYSRIQTPSLSCYSPPNKYKNICGRLAIFVAIT